jgi:hypothetical protein
LSFEITVNVEADALVAAEGRIGITANCEVIKEPPESMTQGMHSKGIVRNLGKPIYSAFKIPVYGNRMIKTQLHGARSSASMRREQATSNAVRNSE